MSKKKKASKSSVATPARKWPKGNEVGVRVRMYRVGFGDFFLVTFRGEDGSLAHVIVDCGVFKGTSQEGDIGTLANAIAMMRDETQGKVSLIVMTHRHADHIAGFARHADIFATMEVGAVWMPVWESEYDAKAVKFQRELTAAAATLSQHFAGMAPTELKGSFQTAKSFVGNALGETNAAGSNAKALQLLKGGLKGGDGAVKAEYYQAGDRVRMPSDLATMGLTCQVLGPPPVTELDMMKLMDLKKGVGQYLVQDSQLAQGGPASPFDNDFLLKTSGTAYPPEAFGEWDERRALNKVMTRSEGSSAEKKMRQSISTLQPLVALTAAKQLNSFLNNQSLVLLFSFKGKSLLFAGDAQAGNWEHWLFESGTPDKLGTSPIGPRARQILTSLDFYKVGHHGSANSTPKVAAEMMCSAHHDVMIMCSTEFGTYGDPHLDDPSKGTEVPRTPLMEKLGANPGRLVRSDQLEVTVDGRVIPPQIQAKLPKTNAGRFVDGPLWIDCFL